MGQSVQSAIFATKCYSLSRKLLINVINSINVGLSLALIHKHIKMIVVKWILETICPYKHIHMPENQIF